MPATKYPQAESPSVGWVNRALAESPRDIPYASFGMDDPAEMARFVLKLKRDRRAKVIDQFNGLDLTKVGQTIFTEDKNGLLYFVQWEDKKFAALPRRHCVQIAVWRRPGAPLGIAGHVFWKHLFPIRGTMMTDAQQTSDAKMFWADRIQESLDRGLFVYRVNIVQHRRDRIATMAEYRQWTRAGYGDKAKHEHERLIIAEAAIA